MSAYVNLTLETLAEEHVCCAIADKKHQAGVACKKRWLSARLPEGHVFRKLQAKGKVFIEYAPVETAWAPVVGDRYLYIYCLWVSGSFKGKGHAHDLLQYCLNDARAAGKSGVCVLASPKKKSFLSDGAFMKKYGFVPVDSVDGGYELLALPFDGSTPRFAESVKKGVVKRDVLTIYYGMQCPYIPNCIEQIEAYCQAAGIPLKLIPVDTLKKAKTLPCVFNNWAVCRNGKFETVHLLNEGYLKKLLVAK